MKYKQRLTSFDAPTPPPASIQGLDLSHAVETYTPGKDYKLDDIPGLPVIKKNGKFKRFVSGNKRVTSMPILTTRSPTKELPHIPNRSISSTHNRFSMPALQEDDFEYQFDSQTLRTLDTTETLDKSGYRGSLYAPFIPNDLNEINETNETTEPNNASITEDSSPVYYDHIITADKDLGSCPSNGSSTSGSIERKYIVDDDEVDSLFSDHPPAGFSPEESCAESILDIVQIYGSESEESDSQSVHSVQSDSDIGSVYTANSKMSEITAKYINETAAADDIISVKDSLFSEDSEESKIDIIDMTRFNNSNASINKALPMINTNVTRSTLSLNKDLPEIDDTPFFKNSDTSSNSLQKETTLNLKQLPNGSSNSLNSNKDLPTPPLNGTPPLNVAKTRNKVNFDETSLQSPSRERRYSSFMQTRPSPTPINNFRPATNSRPPSASRPVSRPASMNGSIVLEPTTRGMLRHRNSFTRPVSMYDQRPVSMTLDSYRGVSNERPLSEMPDVNQSSASFMTTTSLQEAKKELKHQVRQRPFSYCLDVPSDYNNTRYAIPLPKPRAVTQPMPQLQPQTPKFEPQTPKLQTNFTASPVTPTSPNYPVTPTEQVSHSNVTIPRSPVTPSYRSVSQPQFTQQLTPPASPKQYAAKPIPQETVVKQKEEKTKNRIASFLTREFKGSRVSSAPKPHNRNLYYY